MHSHPTRFDPPAWLLRWVDNGVKDARTADPARSSEIDWGRCIPFIGMHLACLGVIWVGVSPIAVAVAALLYAVRMFAITAFYHRYFAHRSFKTSRWMQAAMAVVGCSSTQRDPMWWASHHAHHHAHADEAEDPHSPALLGFWRAHLGWFMTPAAFETRRGYVKDWESYPELRFLNRFDWVPPVALAVLLFCVGELCAAVAPSLGADGPQLLVWAFFISTVVLYHATFTVNSLAHRWGSRRYETSDDSRNNLLIALFTLGEGWHNNHHHYPGSTRQGFFWWEIDVTYYALVALERLGLVWGLRPVPVQALSRNRVNGRPQ